MTTENCLGPDYTDPIYDAAFKLTSIKLALEQLIAGSTAAIDRQNAAGFCRQILFISSPSEIDEEWLTTLVLRQDANFRFDALFNALINIDTLPLIFKQAVLESKLDVGDDFEQFTQDLLTKVVAFCDQPDGEKPLAELCVLDAFAKALDGLV